jgi:ADP-heptose:LPS heptosyltransferase
MNDATYYEQWGPVTRRVRRAGHFARFVAKASLGLRPSLLVELRWRLGDEIMALPVFEALRRKWPQARIDVLSNQPDLFIDHPFVDAVNPAAPSPDVYYLLRGAPRDVHRLAHYSGEAEVPPPEARPRLYYRDWTSPLLRDLPEGEGPLVAIAPGASWSPKRWSADSWRALARELESRGCRVFEVCGAGESVGVECSFAGRTTVREAAVLLHAAKAVVASDSGLMHLARAADAPVVALFGPTDPALLVGDDGGVQRLGNGRDCAGCWNAGRMETPGVCPIGECDCLGTISLERVSGRVWTALGRG